jgi:hypothetical protein
MKIFDCLSLMGEEEVNEFSDKRSKWSLAGGKLSRCLISFGVGREALKVSDKHRLALKSFKLSFLEPFDVCQSFAGI